MSSIIDVVLKAGWMSSSEELSKTGALESGSPASNLCCSSLIPPMKVGRSVWELFLGSKLLMKEENDEVRALPLLASCGMLTSPRTLAGRSVDQPRFRGVSLVSLLLLGWTEVGRPVRGCSTAGATVVVGVGGCLVNLLRLAFWASLAACSCSFLFWRFLFSSSLRRS